MLRIVGRVHLLALASLCALAGGCSSGSRFAAGGGSNQTSFQSPDLPPDRVLAIAETFERQGNSAKARELYSRLGETCPDFRPTAERRVQIMAQRGNSRDARATNRQIARGSQRVGTAPKSAAALANASSGRRGVVHASARNPDENAETEGDADANEESGNEASPSTQEGRRAAFQKLDSLQERQIRLAQQEQQEQQEQQDASEDIRKARLGELISRLKSGQVEAAELLSRVEPNPRIILRVLHEVCDRETSPLAQAYLADTMLHYAPDDVAALRSLVKIVASADSEASSAARALLVARATGHESLVAGQLAFLMQDNDPGVRACASWQLGLLKASGEMATVSAPESATVDGPATRTVACRDSSE